MHSFGTFQTRRAAIESASVRGVHGVQAAERGRGISSNRNNYTFATRRSPGEQARAAVPDAAHLKAARSPCS